MLARCFQLQDAIDVLELDRVLDESPEKLAAYRRGLMKARQERRELISEGTEHLLACMGAGCWHGQREEVLPPGAVRGCSPLEQPCRGRRP